MKIEDIHRPTSRLSNTDDSPKVSVLHILLLGVLLECVFTLPRSHVTLCAFDLDTHHLVIYLK